MRMQFRVHRELPGTSIICAAQIPVLALTVNAAEHAVFEQHVVLIAHYVRVILSSSKGEPAVVDTPRPRAIHHLARIHRSRAIAVHRHVDLPHCQQSQLRYLRSTRPSTLLGVVRYLTMTNRERFICEAVL